MIKMRLYEIICLYFRCIILPIFFIAILKNILFTILKYIKSKLFFI